MAKAKTHAPTDRVELYDKYISSHPEIVRKGAANPYTSVNGHMFSCLSRDGSVAVRVSRKDRDDFLEKHPDSVFISYNTVMKEYILLPFEIFEDEEAFMFWLNKSYDYVSSLKPKPTTRKKS